MGSDNGDWRHPIEKELEGKSEKEKLLYEYHQEDKAFELGLINIWAYHCKRCNYVWLPKDFDFDKKEPFRKNSKWGIWGQDLFFRDSPKSCARCKSKSWKNQWMKRKSKSAIVDDETGWIKEPTSWKRWGVLIRQGRFLDAVELRPDSKDFLLMHKILRKVKIDGKQHLSDRTHYLKEPELEPEQK